MRNPTLSERKRAEYLLECIANADDRAIRRKLGIPDKGFKKRLVHNLTKYCTIADAPRSGRPRIYTPETHEAAKAQLLQLEDTVFSSQEFVRMLQDRKILPPDAKHGSYMRAFKSYLSSKGLQLAYGQRKLTFALSNRHIAARLAWCQGRGVTFTNDTVKTFWFADEITISYGGKPKGKPDFLHCFPGVHATILVHANAACTACSTAVQSAYVLHMVAGPNNYAWLGADGLFRFPYCVHVAWLQYASCKKKEQHYVTHECWLALPCRGRVERSSLAHQGPDQAWAEAVCD